MILNQKLGINTFGCMTEAPTVTINRSNIIKSAVSTRIGAARKGNVLRLTNNLLTTGKDLTQKRGLVLKPLIPSKDRTMNDGVNMVLLKSERYFP